MRSSLQACLRTARAIQEQSKNEERTWAHQAIHTLGNNYNVY